MKWHSTMGVSTSPGRERIIEIMVGETMASMSTPFLRRVMMVVIGYSIMVRPENVQVWVVSSTVTPRVCVMMRSMR